MQNKIDKNKADAAEVITHDVTPLTVNTDAAAYARVGWFVILFGVLGFLLWASLAPLDRGVPMSGVVAKESSRKTIQHQTGGTIQEILVKDGDVVKAGQVLVRMNRIQVDAAAQALRAQYVNMRAAEARLSAERDGLKSVPFPADLKDYKDDPRTTEAMAAQQQLFNSRRSSLENELGAVDQNMEGLKIQMQGVKDSRDSKLQQQAIVKEQLTNVRDLAKDGYVARTRLLDLERTYAQITGSISEDIGTIGRTQRQISELTLRRAQRLQDYQKEVRSTLADTQREAEALASRIAGQDFEVGNAEIKSPVNGTVVGLNVFTRGGVIGAGQKMMEIVPSDDALVVEGQLPVNLIDKVHTGLPVELMFSAFNANKTPHIPGTLIQVSADRTVEERTGQPYYKVRARVTPEGAQLIVHKKMDVQPGMPVEMFIKTGERTMMSYLLKPVFDRAKSSMAED
ncbi:HlyD family type I secretion periplasmic adaptor subunit [Pseudoduganella sp. FT55W]|uniref:Membrane fusion protein (MFP) family protein n=1 Tax=Duganella rivi TaxID=2666083 RepID=A0A7X4GSD8_9BURK|nr:HlyD family type I secretion periplasmic adaptor subunit [Duganella rivi]MYM68817.1 HlyD family type I secretion periplasmic adaptor subunit [Duganella rivi]